MPLMVGVAEVKARVAGTRCRTAACKKLMTESDGAMRLAVPCLCVSNDCAFMMILPTDRHYPPTDVTTVSSQPQCQCIRPRNQAHR